jgi:RNA polymerase sigma-70 factor (ECF subfamily)
MVDERQAIALLKQGQVAGLETLVQLYQLRALRAAYLVVGDRALAEDVVQSAFLRAYDRIGQFDTGRPFGPWFLRSVVNAAIKAGARQARLVGLDPGDEDDEDVSALASRLADQAPGPEEQAELGETRAQVWRALGRLSPAQRGAVVLRYYLDLSESEMAARLERSPGTIKWTLHAARERLRGLLGWTQSKTDSGGRP